MYYQFNVIRKNKHLFATDRRSATSTYEAERLAKVLAEKFPTSEGYAITVSYYEESSQRVSLDALLMREQLATRLAQLANEDQA